MMRALTALACLLLAACNTLPETTVTDFGPVPHVVNDECWQVCKISPELPTAADGSASPDDLGEQQATIEQQKAACENSRKACADALEGLMRKGIITPSGPNSRPPPQ